MTDILLLNLVEDWGGFEKLVAKLHETGTVDVKHDVTLVGKSGAPRQIDVMIKHKEGLYEHLIIVECKHWKKNVSRLHVDALTTSVQDLNASRGVIFTAKGFQEGAITAAKHTGIELYKVREPTDEEWGLPGRVIDFFMQYFQRSIGNVKLHNTMAVGNTAVPIHLKLALGESETESKTPTINKDGTPGRTLEELLSQAASKALDEFTKGSFVLCDGIDCTRYMMGAVNLEPPEPYLVPLENVLAIIPKISFDLGIKIQQSRFMHDRGKDFMFILAVENCVRDGVSLAHRLNDVTHTKLIPISPKDSANKEDTLKNGSVMKIVLKGYFLFDEMAGLQPVNLEEIRRPRKPVD